MENELKAWRERFPQYEYRQQDECIALRMNCRYGCHCDLEDGMEPDGCVLDEGRPQDCVYAGILERDGRTKEHCRYWKPVVPNAEIQAGRKNPTMGEGRSTASPGMES